MILKWATDGWDVDDPDGRWTGVALTYLANLWAIFALAWTVFFVFSTIGV